MEVRPYDEGWQKVDKRRTEKRKMGEGRERAQKDKT